MGTHPKQVKTLKRPQDHKRKKYAGKVKVANLQVDPDVQRMFDNRLANKIEGQWDPLFAGTLVVSHRGNGEYFVLDGQHRLAAAERKEGPDFEFDCEIHEGLTRREEAQMYLRHNKDRKSARPYDNFKVALVAGYKTEVMIDAQVRAVGLEVAGSPSANKVAAVQSLVRIAETPNTPVNLIELTLSVCERAWGRDSTTWDSLILQAVARVIGRNANVIDLNRLTRVLAKSTVDQWKAQAVATAKGGGGSVSRSNALAELIVPNYNSRLRRTSARITA